MSISKMSYLLIGIILSNAACLKRLAVEPDSAKIPQADYLEVWLKSGEKYVLTDVTVQDDYMEGKYRNETIQIALNEIQSVEIINRDYGKAALYSVVGSAVAVAITLWLAERVPTN